eukprot:GHVH01007267.1.p1 GENE.GHVH01007267.1~~GHVH01007267.1.p1  ORF type:complete len:321 (+),score=60.73 GHVH01007267.1:36-965(+)
MVKSSAKKSRVVIREPTNEPDAPLDKSLFDEKPKAILTGRDGGDVRVEKATWKKDKLDRRIAKRKALLLKEMRKDQLERKRFLNPIKSMEEFEKRAVMRANDARVLRMRSKSQLRTRKKCLYSESGGQASVIMIIRNDVPFPSKTNYQRLTEWNISTFFWGTIKPNTPEIIAECEALKKYIFYGLPSSAVLKRTILKKGCLWATVDESTTDFAKAHRTGKKEYVDVKKDIVPFTDNTELERRMGYLDVLSFEDLMDRLVEGGDGLQACLNHLGPLRMHDLRKAKETALDNSREKGRFNTEKLDSIIEKI